MFGYLRFILAFFVLVSHVDVRFYGLNPGVIAVVIFYMLAGYVVSRLWRDILPMGRRKLYNFYRDRVLRILPLYIYVAVLTLIFLSVTGFADPEVSFSKLMGNFLIVPLNYYMVLDTTILTNPDWCLIPPAWSLGTELQAYILLPLVLMFKKLKILLAALSFGVYMLANFAVINPDYFGYRLIFGVFFIFVTGTSLQTSLTNRGSNRSKLDFDKLYPWLLWVVVALSGLVFTCKNLFHPSYTKETFTGILIGIPLIYFIARSANTGRNGRLVVNLPGNALLGSLSYGVFLSHFLIIWWLDYTCLIGKQTMAYIPAITLFSTFVAYSGVRFLEKRINKIRKKTGKSICF